MLLKREKSSNITNKEVMSKPLRSPTASSPSGPTPVVSSQNEIVNRAPTKQPEISSEQDATVVGPAFADFKAELAAAAATLQSVQHERQSLSKALTRAEGDCQRMSLDLTLIRQEKSDRETYFSERIAGLSLSLDTAILSVETEQTQRERLEIQLGEMSNANKRQSAEIKDLEKENDGLSKEVAELKADNDDLRAQVAKLSAEKQVVESQASGYEAEVKGLKTQVELMEEEEEALRTTAQTFDTEKQALQKRIDEMAQELQEMKSAQQAKDEEQTKQLGKISMLMAEANFLRKENGALRQRQDNKAVKPTKPEPQTQPATSVSSSPRTRSRSASPTKEKTVNIPSVTITPSTTLESNPPAQDDKTDSAPAAPAEPAPAAPTTADAKQDAKESVLPALLSENSRLTTQLYEASAKLALQTKVSLPEKRGRELLALRRGVSVSSRDTSRATSTTKLKRGHSVGSIQKRRVLTEEQRMVFVRSKGVGGKTGV
jgi:hypothetical protein